MARVSTAQRGEARASTRLSRRAFVQHISGLGAAVLLSSCGGQVVTPPLTPTPRPTTKLRRIGYLSGSITSTALNYLGPFLEQLRDLGYMEGRDFEIVPRIAENVPERLPSLAAELVAMPVDVLVAESNPAQNAAKAATKTIPIVITLAADPVATGLVSSLAKPGGNITGMTTASPQLTAKRVELLKGAVPSLARVGVIWNANIPSMRTTTVQATVAGAQVLHVETQVFDVLNPGELDAAVEAIARQHLDGLVMLTGLSIIRDFHQVPDLAARYRLPQIFSDIEIVRAGGGLMHFGTNYATLYRGAAVVVDKLLRGANPADIPIEQPTKFDLVVNRTMADRLGLTIPDTILRQAEVVR